MSPDRPVPFRISTDTLGLISTPKLFRRMNGGVVEVMQQLANLGLLKSRYVGPEVIGLWCVVKGFVKECETQGETLVIHSKTGGRNPGGRWSQLELFMANALLEDK